MTDVRVAINGFGRIGRLAFRQMFVSDGYEVVAINDLTSPDMLAYLLAHDSSQGKWTGHKVTSDENSITVDGKKITIYQAKDAAALPWKDLDIDVVLECTGFYTKKDKAMAHINAGAKKVVISAPAGNDMPTIVYSVNEKTLKPEDKIISAASCTTNCLAPMADTLNKYAPIQSGIMCTVHGYTGDQMLLDGPQRKGVLRRSRAAAINVVPASSGAAKAIGLVIPELNGKLTGMSMRVPTLDVSVVDLTVNLVKPASYQEICDAMKAASEGELKGVLGYTEDAVVSSDFLGCPLTSIFDAKAGIALTDKFVKVVSWYDNEIGYSHKVVELIKIMKKCNG